MIRLNKSWRKSIPFSHDLKAVFRPVARDFKVPKKIKVAEGKNTQIHIEDKIYLLLLKQVFAVYKLKKIDMQKKTYIIHKFKALLVT